MSAQDRRIARARTLQFGRSMRYLSILELPAVCTALVVSSASLDARAEDGVGSRHGLWMQALYLPRPLVFPMGDGNADPQFSGGDHLGIAGGYAYRIADNFSLGIGASARGFPGGDDYRSVNAFSLPLLVSFDPHVTRHVRLMMTAGIGYLRLWGNQTYGGDAWYGDGIEGMVELGAALQVSSQIELLASVGVRGGYASLYSIVVPIGLGLRFSLGGS